jgi:hypothetical protein
MRLTSTITFSMVAISEWEEEEALCCDGGARKVLEGSGRIEGEELSSVSEVCERIEATLLWWTGGNCHLFLDFSSHFAPSFFKSSGGNSLGSSKVVVAVC